MHCKVNYMVADLSHGWSLPIFKCQFPKPLQTSAELRILAAFLSESKSLVQDVYTEIAQLVQKQVDLDEARGIPEATVLRDNVDRKLVKQTVMTSVYGVTFVGARHQIGNRLKERGWEDDRLVYKASCYGARVSPHPTCIPTTRKYPARGGGGEGRERGLSGMLTSLAGLSGRPLHASCCHAHA